MVFQELLHEERMEGKAEGRVEAKIEDIFEILSEFGEEIPIFVEEKVRLEKDLEVLKRYFTAAAKAESMDDFVERIK